jgi:hypothetical protein
MIETITRPGGRGSPRFIVRGQRYLPLDQAALLRALYNEYPERFPLEPEYPAPGRRGGSRPPARQGEEAALVARPAGVYPTARPRDALADISLSGGLPLPSSPNASAVNREAGAGGTFFNRFTGVVAGATTVLVSERISQPFVIKHAQGWIDIASQLATAITIRVAQDNDTSGGTATSGTNIEGLGVSGATFGAMNLVGDIWPNIRWTQVPCFIKFVWQNAEATTRMFWTSIDIHFLD